MLPILTRAVLDAPLPGFLPLSRYKGLDQPKHGSPRRPPVPLHHTSHAADKDWRSPFNRNQRPLLLGILVINHSVPQNKLWSKASTATLCRPHIDFLPFSFSAPAHTMTGRSRGVWRGLTALSMILLVQWAGSCTAMTLNSLPLRPVPDTTLGVQDEDTVLQRQKRNWVWNQFFVLEEYTGDDPLYVGKVNMLLPSYKADP
ncbi:Cadherin-20 [Bagarius yarrelli]|uniref:Cadherin-20 n=1 Tax=Bagarius yarrelli TaxID=175774 RepID=A0A556UAP8_BAGYA|nr:Cadherin-20 [Bagarius yarrelli]